MQTIERDDVKRAKRGGREQKTVKQNTKQWAQYSWSHYGTVVLYQRESHRHHHTRDDARKFQNGHFLHKNIACIRVQKREKIPTVGF
jgi:hypothetical protein